MKMDREWINRATWWRCVAVRCECGACAYCEELRREKEARKMCTRLMFERKIGDYVNCEERFIFNEED